MFYHQADWNKSKLKRLLWSSDSNEALTKVIHTVIYNWDHFVMMPFKHHDTIFLMRCRLGLEPLLHIWSRDASFCSVLIPLACLLTKESKRYRRKGPSCEEMKWGKVIRIYKPNWKKRRSERECESEEQKNIAFPLVYMAGYMAQEKGHNYYYREVSGGYILAGSSYWSGQW